MRMNDGEPTRGRLRLLEVDPVVLVTMLKADPDFSGLPGDARCVGAAVDGEGNLCLRVESATFAEVTTWERLARIEWAWVKKRGEEEGTAGGTGAGGPAA